jgi:hypothetical protein
VADVFLPFCAYSGDVSFKKKEFPMNNQTLTRPTTLCNFLVTLPEEPICASSRDYGFDLDEEEVGREMLAPLPANLAYHPVPEFDPDEFETRHLWFLS